MTIGEAHRRYGRPVLKAETLKDRIWECEDRARYYALRCKNIKQQLESCKDDEFDDLYSQLTEAERFRESYLTEGCLLIIKAASEK